MSIRARIGPVVVVLLSLWAAAAAAQTPSPFPSWMNAAGIVLAPLGGPVPDWRVDVGGGGAFLPLYEGADHYHVVPSPLFDIRYKDIAFLSLGDGLGVNLLRGQTYRAGLALNYDVGRWDHVSGRLNGLGSISAAPEARAFAEMALLPFVFTADLSRALGGTEGVTGNLGIYVPVVGGHDLVVFVGPSISFANHRYMQAYFGVSSAQSAGSSAHFPVYQASSGAKDAGIGVTAIYHFTDHWFLDAEGSYERLVGSAGNSPIVQDRDQFGTTLMVGYQF